MACIFISLSRTHTQMIAECLVAEFRIDGDDCPLARATDAVPVAVDARAATPRRRQRVAAVQRTGERRPHDYLDGDDRIRYLYQSVTEGRYNYRCLSLQQCVVHKLISAGFMVESLTYRDGNAV